jgi:hypothetical protein
MDIDFQVTPPKFLFDNEVENFSRAFAMRVCYQAGLSISAATGVSNDSEEFERYNATAFRLLEPMAKAIVEESLERIDDQVRRSVKRCRSISRRQPVPAPKDVDLFTAYAIERAEFYGAFLASEVLNEINSSNKEGE